MNYKMIGKIISRILLGEAVFMLPSLFLSVYDKDYKTAIAFLITVLILVAFSSLMFLLCKKAKQRLYVKDGLCCVGLAWIAMSFFGCLPFCISGEIPSLVDAFFETVSGFTTTGASILPNVELLSRGALFWRSFTHWLGGMGVLVLLMALSPANRREGGSTLHLLRAESTGPSVEKLVPKMQTSAKILYIMYIVLTVINIIFLLAGKMPLFDTICTVFGTAGTGGFGVKADSLAGYSPYIQNVTTVFMALFGVNFSLYYFMLIKQFKNVFKNEELWLYIGTIIASISLVAFNIKHLYSTIGETIRHAAFQVSSIITTTGFSTVDFDQWPNFSKTVLLCLMIIGACAGSTGGGLKCARVLLLFKGIGRTVKRILSPQRIEKVRINGNVVADDVIQNTNVYFVIYFIITVLSFLLISIDGFSVTTNFSAVLACVNNIGPGLESVGPAMNYSAYSAFSKIILSANMLIGRLEIYPILIFFSRHTWKKV